VVGQRSGSWEYAGQDDLLRPLGSDAGRITWMSCVACKFWTTEVGFVLGRWLSKSPIGHDQQERIPGQSREVSAGKTAGGTSEQPTC